MTGKHRSRLGKAETENGELAEERGGEAEMPDIRALRGSRTRAELAAELGVTALSVYRWELPPGAAEARRPRGKVLARVRALAAKTAAASSARDERTILPEDSAELALVRSAQAAMDECQLERAEAELVARLTSGELKTDAGRAYAAILLARVQLLARHDTKASFSTLLAAAFALERLPSRLQLEYHLTAAFLHGHPDAQLFNPGKTNHHATLAQTLITEGDGNHRFFLWYAQFTAAVSSYEVALISRAVQGLPAVRELATTPLNRCLVVESDALAGLGIESVAEATRRVEQLADAAAKSGLPLQRVRSLLWKAEVAVEDASPPAQILDWLDEADRLQRRGRIMYGTHAMLGRRNRGETLIRLGRFREAEAVLGEALEVARAISYTPIRLHTTLARLFIQAERLEDVASLVAAAKDATDGQRELTRGAGKVLAILLEVCRGDAAADWGQQVVTGLEELRQTGVWAVPYRHLALLSFAIAVTRGGVVDAQRIGLVAARAVDASPSVTASATLRRHRARLLLRRGRITEARQMLEAALGTFEGAGDVSEAALARHALACAASREKAPEAERLMEEALTALRALGLPPPPAPQVEVSAPEVETGHVFDATAPRPSGAAGLESLVVPLQRLATRGIAGAFLQKELVAVAGELFAGRSVSLEAVDSVGGTTALGGREGSGGEAPTWFELGDGLGRRFRLGIGGVLDEEDRARAQILSIASSLALETSALRTLASPPATRASADGAAPETAALAGVVAASPSMRRLKDELVRLSGSRATIILTGESGTGKEVIARAIHDLSRRAKGPYVTFNSATVPRDLFEGQLFGYRKGAFTGATADHPGVIRAANGGTLFLDEIGELPLDIQPKLLRFLENAEILPLGERAPVRVDVRVVTATHRDLASLVRAGKFREDLYYRLQVIPVSIAPLRDRREDIVPLARFFLAKMTPPGAVPPVLTSDGEARLVAHRWPGNVRELRNVIERCLAFDPLPRIIAAQDLHL